MFHSAAVSTHKIRTALVTLTSFGALSASLPASASARFEVDDTRWLSLGAGVRLVYSSTENGAPDGRSRSNDFDVNSIRLYLNGQVHENVQFTINTEEIDDSIDILDAVLRFEFSSGLNLWAGKMLAPADRIGMNGPYYGLSWNQYSQPLYPSGQGGEAGRLGRDEGVTAWGSSGKFQYALGIFDGLDGLSNTGDDLLFAGRFAYNLLNMEKSPGYYTSSSYHGRLGDILTLGVSFQSQSGGSGTATSSGDFSGYAVDLFYENVLSRGSVFNLEAKYTDFDADYTRSTSPADTSAANPCFCLFKGTSYFLSAGYLMSDKVGPGKLQPYLRYVSNSPADGDDSVLTEIGINYVVDGHNLRFNANYASGGANLSGYSGADVDRISLGAQWQF